MCQSVLRAVCQLSDVVGATDGISVTSLYVTTVSRSVLCIGVNQPAGEICGLPRISVLGIILLDFTGIKTASLDIMYIPTGYYYLHLNPKIVLQNTFRMSHCIIQGLHPEWFSLSYFLSSSLFLVRGIVHSFYLCATSYQSL